MSDFERYGDYNEVDEPPTKSKVGFVLKLFIVILCFGVVGFLVFRVLTFNFYPNEMKKIYFTEELTAIYNEQDGDIGALTQDLLNSRSFGYDDSTEGNFFAKYFVYIPETEELQITLKYNTSLMKSIKDKYGIELDPNGEDNFEFRLVAARSSDETEPTDTESISHGIPMEARVVAEEYDSALMYRYIRLVFDGVKLDRGTPSEVNWIRLEININGVQMNEPYMILIYWDNDSFPLEPYKLSKKEKP